MNVPLEEGIGYAQRRSAVSYPENGNDSCLKLEDACFLALPREPYSRLEAFRYRKQTAPKPHQKAVRRFQPRLCTTSGRPR
jgi:hypothetical protein